jgi:hypothetical protein
MKEGIHIQAQRLMGGIYELAVEMGSGTMIYIPSFIKTASGMQKLMGSGDSQIHRQHEHGISLLSSFQNKKSRLKRSLGCCHTVTFLFTIIILQHVSAL